ncbi:hypothetical protein JCM4814A_90130 [Streptomyces phaeofaciens JCM 4814]|uniref:Uncharacterized protein n=1 Tax=Streptomyces phaeofaciens TaxID=68254 RepID=A0A918HNF2_9ACTN|nr:hypothetical protein GCM10010226_68590 [Streptomyces phaeofaciens]
MAERGERVDEAASAPWSTSDEPQGTGSRVQQQVLAGESGRCRGVVREGGRVITYNGCPGR